MKLQQFISRAFVVESAGNQPVSGEVFCPCENIDSCREILDLVAAEIREELSLEDAVPIQFVTRLKS